MGERTRVTSGDVDPTAGTLVAPLVAETATREVRIGSTTSTEDAPTLVGNRYEILGMLGAGGMGTVYRARDRELEEIVALKVLKKELAATSGMLERFRREVKLARRVTHKNVARTFDIGDHEGDRFLTMELIPGEMLGAYLARRGPLPVRTVITIAQDVCAGLAAAHAADVLHRDLKPENVILAPDGRAVITDFGIARAIEQAEAARTAPGLVGTPAYMAPEQVEGVTDLDARADLYALGAMLFELLTGKPAWPGDSVIAIAAARILRPPPDVRSVNPALPADIAEVVLKLMARSRDDRFATAEEAGAALAALATAELPSGRSLPPASLAASPRVRAPRKTVAVLPIVNLSGEDDAHLAAIVTEDLVDLLSVVPELRVRPRGESAGIDTRKRDVRDAGRELGVDVVVDGSLRRHEELVRISVRVITVEDGFQLWARRFDRAPGEVLSVADDAASAIASALATERTAEARPVSDPRAQELYLRGRYLLHRGWITVSEEGVELLRQAHELAPQDSRIAGSYALAIARILTTGAADRPTGVSARALAEKTVELDPAQPEARVALAIFHLGDSEGAGAAVHLQRALAISPNNLEALDAAGRILVEVGRPEVGIRTMRKVLAIDPTMLLAKHTIVRAHALLGDRDVALEMLGPPPEDPNDFAPHMLLRARMALWYGDVAAAKEIVRIVESSATATPFAKRSVLGMAAVTISRSLAPNIRVDLETSLPFDPQFLPRRLSFHAQYRVEVKLAAGEVDSALADLRVGDSNGLLDLLWLDRNPIFDRVRDRPEFAAIRATTAVRAERVARILDP
jgi:eukaryotic-like serine/threonine-protein kinase